MKSLRTVFAVVAGPEVAERAVAAYQALPFAEPARLIGLHISPIAISYGLGADIALASYIEAQIEAADDIRKAAEAAFRSAADRAGIPNEWRSGQAMGHLLSPQAGSMARAADMILFPELPEDSGLGRHAIEELVATSGRPVIRIPLTWRGGEIGEKVLVAWDGGREAARAVFDAMPVLTQAKLVRLVSVLGFVDEPVRQFTLGDDIAATLTRHGIRVETQTAQSARGSVQQELLQQALDFGADLIVMGCYGHSRFRELILGGVTRDMLRGGPLPVLMSS